MVNLGESLDLAAISLERLQEQVSWEVLSSAVRRLDRWDESLAAKLDDFYRVRMVRALRSRESEEELAAFSGHLALAAHDLRKEQLNALPRPYFDRWRAWSDLLATRHRMVSTPGWLKAILANRRKARIVYQVTRAGRISQDSLRQCFQDEFSAPYLTRLLNELEANLLIERVRSPGDARQKDILPGSDAPALAVIEPFLDAETRAACEAKLAVRQAADRAAQDTGLPAAPFRQKPGLGRHMTGAPEQVR